MRLHQELEKLKRLNWSGVCSEHDNLSRVLEYADSTKDEIRAAAVFVCLALNGLHEQLRHQALCSSPPIDTQWERDRKDLLECESILSSVVDFVNIWSREAGLPEIHSAGQITKAIDKLWSCASFRDVTMQSTLSSIAASSCCQTCQEAGRVAADGLRVASLGERLWIHRTPEFDPSRYDAQGNAKPSAEAPHKS